MEEIRSLIDALVEFNRMFHHEAIKKGRRERSSYVSGAQTNKYKGKEIKDLISENMNKQEQQNERIKLENDVVSIENAI